MVKRWLKPLWQMEKANWIRVSWIWFNSRGSIVRKEDNLAFKSDRFAQVRSKTHTSIGHIPLVGFMGAM